MAYGCRIMPSNASTAITSYSESFENFPNPERGFYIPVNPEGYRAFSPLQTWELQAVRNQIHKRIR